MMNASFNSNSRISVNVVRCMKLAFMVNGWNSLQFQFRPDWIFGSVLASKMAVFTKADASSSLSYAVDINGQTEYYFASEFLLCRSKLSLRSRV